MCSFPLTTPSRCARSTCVLIFCMYSLTVVTDTQMLFPPLFGRPNWGSVRLGNAPCVSWGDGSVHPKQPLLQNPACRTACHAVPGESMLSRTRNEPSSGARHHTVCGTVCTIVLNSAGDTGSCPTVAWLGVVTCGLSAHILCLPVRSQLWRQPSSRVCFLVTTSRAQKGRLVFTRKPGISQVRPRSWLTSEARGGSYGEGPHLLYTDFGVCNKVQFTLKICDSQRR